MHLTSTTMPWDALPALGAGRVHHSFGVVNGPNIAKCPQRSRIDELELSWRYCVTLYVGVVQMRWFYPQRAGT